MAASIGCGSAMNEKKARELVYARSRHLCEVCGLRPASNVQHRKARAQGGKWEPSNLLHVCGSGTTGCHGRIHAHPRHAYRTGWSIHAWENPLETPVFVWSHGVCYLDDAGDFHKHKPSHGTKPNVARVTDDESEG